MTPGTAAAQDRPAIIVDLSVLDALKQPGETGRPSWSPPIPERRPIPPVQPRPPVFAEPRTAPVPAQTPVPTRSARTEPATAGPAATPTPLSVSRNTAPSHSRRPIPVTANALFIRQITPLLAVPAPPGSGQSTGPEADVATPGDAAGDAEGDAPGDVMADIVSPLPGADGFRMVFAGDRTKLSETGERLLDTVAERLKAEDDLRLTVQAYAGGSPETASRSRLLSLERGLAVRNYLSERGVRGSRIDLRALGNTFADGPPERVDLLLLAQ